MAVEHVVTGPADAPVLVLAGSLGSTWAMWDPQVAELGDRFRVVRYDHRGHGRSPVPPGPYRIEDLGADLLGLLDRLGVARAHLCGLSLGAMTALWVAAHAPDRVDRLVLCCTSARLGPPEDWLARAATVRAEGAGAVAATVVGRWFTPRYAAAHPDTVARMQAMVAATPREGYAGCCEAIAAMDLTPALARVRAPTLVVAGAQDPVATLEHAQRLVAGIPAAGLAVLDPAAHLATVEQAGVATRLLLDHLTAQPSEAT